jgi:mRNA interferase MazF
LKLGKYALLFIVSSDGVGKLPIKLIVPITDWKEYYEDNIWHVRINPDNINNLIKISANVFAWLKR